MSEVVTYPAPIGLPQVVERRLTVDGHGVAIHPTPVADHAKWSCDGPCTLELELPAAIDRVRVQPASLGLEAEVDGRRLRLALPGPCWLRLEVDDRPALYCHVLPLETEIPARDDPRVHWFDGGVVHDVGRFEIGEGETVYIAGGTVVRGMLFARGRSAVRVLGRGLLYGPGGKGHGPHARLLLFEQCRDVRVHGITGIDTPSWHCHLAGCTGVEVDRFACIGWIVGSDGIDIQGSSRVHVHDCCLHCNDDCLVVKGGWRRTLPDGTLRDASGECERILMERCVLYNAQAGNAMEIGFECRESRYGDIRFRDIDVIGAHGEGGVFTIHNGDSACVRDVTWEDIRVEHFYDKLIDFRVLDSRWSQTAERGTIRDIVLRRITVCADVFNSPSLIGGWDAEHDVRGIRIESLTIGDRPILDPDALQLFTRHAEDVRFAP